jgi:hypothetical protein
LKAFLGNDNSYVMVVPDSSAPTLAAFKRLSNSRKLSVGGLIVIDTSAHDRRKLFVSDWDYLNRFPTDEFVRTGTLRNNGLRLLEASSPEDETHRSTPGKNRNHIGDPKLGQREESPSIPGTLESSHGGGNSGAPGGGHNPWGELKNDTYPEALSLKELGLAIVSTKRPQLQASLSQSSPAFLAAYPSSRR